MSPSVTGPHIKNHIKPFILHQDREYKTVLSIFLRYNNVLRVNIKWLIDIILYPFIFILIHAGSDPHWNIEF